MSGVELLSRKPLNEFTPSEYKLYVKSLYHKRTPRKAKKKPLAPFRWRKNAKGTLIIKFNRDWVSEEDLKMIATESGTPYAEVWIKVFNPKSKKTKKPRLSTAEAEEKTTKTVVVPEL